MARKATKRVAAAPVLELRGVSKRYGRALVLDKIDLSLAEHEVVCLIGASGSGKSTLLRCADLLEPIDGGSITLDGRTVSADDRDADATRRQLGIVFQGFSLFPHLTALENVAGLYAGAPMPVRIQVFVYSRADLQWGIDKAKAEG